MPSSRCHCMRFAGIPAAVLVLGFAPLHAAVTAPAAPVTKFQVRATPEPSPALKYRLLPTFRELTPGNAAVIYAKIAGLEGPRSDGENEATRKIGDDWYSMPISELPRAEVEKALQIFSYRLAEADRAARMETCDWLLPIRNESPWTVMIPEVQGMRNLARVIRMRVRLLIADGKYDEAIHMLQTGFAMARHTAEGPTLVNGLVGIAIASILFEQVDDLMRAPGAPNLYWALMALPRPLIDLRPGIEAEMHFIDFAFPKLADIEAAKFSREQWRDELLHVLSAGSGLMYDRPASGFFDRPEVIAAALAVKTYPRAKRLMIEGGMSPAEAEKLPVAEVVLRGMVQDYRRVRDEQFKWMYVPFAQQGDGPERADRVIKEAESEYTGFPLVNLIAAVPAVRVAQARSDRMVPSRAAVEVLRIHAAAHGGKLPVRLSEVTLAPILDDPVTGQPFNYTLNGRTAVISSPAPAGRSPEHNALHFEITIEP